MKLTNEDLLDLRQALRVGKQNSVFAHVRLAYAVDKNLRTLDRELEAFESQRDTLIDQYAERDDEDRKIHVVHPDGVRIVRDGDEWLYAEDGAGHKAGERFAPASEVARIASAMGVALDDRDAFEDELQQILDEQVEVTIHEVEEELLWEHAEIPSGVHQRMDMAALDPMLTDG